jgi:4'-phosphopantetheinyl transferase
MPDIGWLTRALADVPTHDRWLSERERDVLATLRIPKRRDDWRLGRWTGKAAVAARRGVDAAEVEILAAADGVPEALVGGTPISLALSLSHRAGRALVAVRDGPGTLGCDLEVVEARSPAFMREWLGPGERRLVEAAQGELRDVAPNLVWSAKEAASKARRGGLRLNVRRAVVELDDLEGRQRSWHRVRVAWDEGPVEVGWWRREPGWVMTVVGDSVGVPPTELN